MKRKQDTTRSDKKKALGLKKETLRQLEPADLEQVGGGWNRTCMGTYAQYWVFP